MKIIGKVNSDTYLAEVSHGELEKCANKYYGNLKKLDVSDTFNVGAGYEFSDSIRRVCASMQEAMKSFESAREMMMRFSIMVSQLPADKGDGGEA